MVNIMYGRVVYEYAIAGANKRIIKIVITDHQLSINHLSYVFNTDFYMPILRHLKIDRGQDKR